MMQPAQHRLCDNLKADRQTTSVGHFELIGDVERAHVGKIAYFESITELLAMTATRKSPFDDALVKRAAFEREREVRYLTNGHFLKNTCVARVRGQGLPKRISQLRTSSSAA